MYQQTSTLALNDDARGKAPAAVREGERPKNELKAAGGKAPVAVREGGADPRKETKTAATPYKLLLYPNSKAFPPISPPWLFYERISQGKAWEGPSARIIVEPAHPCAMGSSM